MSSITVQGKIFDKIYYVTSVTNGLWYWNGSLTLSPGTKMTISLDNVLVAEATWDGMHLDSWEIEEEDPAVGF